MSVLRSRTDAEQVEPPAGEPADPPASAEVPPGPVGATAAALPGHPRRRRALGWAGLLVLLTGVLVALLWRRFHYANDDLLQFSVARDEGLSWQTLTLNVFQHVAPYNRMGHLLVFRVADLSPFAGLAFMAVNELAMLAAALWLMTELRLSTTRRVVALVVIGLGVPVSESAIWFDSSMHVLAAIAVTLAICAAHVRGVRTGLRRWHVVALVLFVLGQLTQERPLFALPVAVLIDLLLLWRFLPWGERLRRLWTLRWPLLPMTVVAAAIAVGLRVFVVLDHLPVPDVPTTLRTMLSALVDYLVPSLVNLPLSGPLPMAGQFVALGAVLVLGLVVARAARGNAGPVLFVAAVFLLYYGFLKVSPLLNESTIDANAQRLTNAVYVTVPAVIALAHVRLPVPSRWESRSRRRPWAAAVAVLLLAGYLGATNIVYLDRQWAAPTAARGYLDAVRADAAQWSAPDVSLVPLSAPRAMGVGWSAPFLEHDHLLSLVSRGFVRGEYRGRPVLIDNRGQVRRAALLDSDATVQIVSGGCDQPSSVGDGSVLITVDRVLRSGPWFLLVDYEADRELRAQLGTHDGALGWRVAAGPTKLDEGTHHQLVPLGVSSVDAVDLRPLAGADLCVSDVELVRPVLVEAGGDRCRAIDRYGRPGGRVRCE